MENVNSCCYITKVKEIKTIPGADNIEQVIVNGWECITKKGEYNVNDLVVIATTDAVIPFELSEKLGITNYLRKGQRVRTVKLRGVYSECLIIPISYIQGVKRFEGSDCMETLNIFKFEPPVKQIQLASGKKIRYHQNPNFHIYYKFPNMKNVPDMFTEDDIVEVTRKYHGTNARYGIVKKSKITIFDRIKKLFGNKWAEYEFVVGSHNVEKGSDSQGFYDENVWFTISNKLKLKQKLFDYVKENFYNPSELGSGITIYGEIYGPGIQKNFDYNLQELQFKVFDITVDGTYLSPMDSIFECNYIGLDYVEVLYYGNYNKEKIDQYVFNNFIEGTKVPHEGVVVKDFSGDHHKRFKIINPDYLIYGEKNNVGDSH